MEFEVSHNGRHPETRVQRVLAAGNRVGFILPDGSRVKKARPQSFEESYILDNLDAFCEGIDKGLITVSAEGLEYSTEMLRQLRDSVRLLSLQKSNEKLTEEKEVFEEELTNQQEVSEKEQIEEQEVSEEEEVSEETNEDVSSTDTDQVEFVDAAYFMKFSRSKLNKMARAEYGISNPSQHSKSELVDAILATLEEA